MKRARARSRLEDESDATNAVRKQARKSIACERCHSHKVKCSGGQPCKRCRDADGSPQCVYPVKNRQVRVSSQYIDTILKENETLRTRDASVVSHSEPAAATPAVTATTLVETNDTVRDPLFRDRPWFHPLASVDMPIHISEAADASFATRFRQTLASVSANHIPRMSYVTDDYIRQLSVSDQNIWPTPARARFMANAALTTICRYYHIVRKKVILDSLEVAIQNGGNGDRLTICKLLTLFAVGELYSTKIATPDSSFPGLEFFARARPMVSIPSERPLLDTLEIVLLFVVYSFALNRRHSAYTLASSGVRLATIMGMHLNIPEHQFRDRNAREHRTRLWWSAYIFDRMSASKIGQPPSISFDDILVDLPSKEGLNPADEDFENTDYVLQHIELATLSSQTIGSIYSRRRHQTPFSQRVQIALKNITRWMESLPTHLQLGGSNGATVTHNQLLHLHLRFNQAVIVATRPVLLHVLRCHKESWTDCSKDPKQSLADGAVTLAETCIQCARHSYRLLSDAWVQGFFPIFDYFNTQFLFAAATTLVISSLLGWNQSRSDGDRFNSAVDIMTQVGQSGNFAAKEFCLHIDAMKQSIAKARPGHYAGDIAISTLAPPTTPMSGFMDSNTGKTMTAGMALADPSLQEFLAEPDLNLQLLEPSTFEGFNTLYWPEFWGDGWTG